MLLPIRRSVTLLMLLVIPCMSLGHANTVRVLTDVDSSSRAPSWSPDGKRIAFESDRSGRWSVYVLELETGKVERLIHSRSNDRYPGWSPDGQRLVFVSDREGEMDLHVLDVRSGRSARLLAAPGEDMFPAWSPDGKTIAFARQLADSVEIRTVRVGESVLDSFGAGVWPRWSPDGNRIAFFSRRDTGGSDDEVYVLDRRTGVVTRLTDRPGHDFCPSWSPGGDKLVVASIQPDGARSLRILKDTGAEEGRLGRGYHRVTEPSWSPDGRYIAYAAIRTAGQPYQLFLEAVERD